MSPAPHTYLDQKYDESTELGLSWAGTVEVRDAYEWDPAAVIPDAGVVGVEAALWTETTVTRDDVDYMTFPRLPAVAEVGWSARRDWEDFRTRLAAHGPLLESLGVNFFRHRRSTGTLRAAPLSLRNSAMSGGGPKRSRRASRRGSSSVSPAGSMRSARRPGRELTTSASVASRNSSATPSSAA